MLQISDDEWQNEKTMTTGSILCSIIYFLFSFVRSILMMVARIIERDKVSTGLGIEGERFLITLIRNFSMILATWNMPIVLLLLVAQNDAFRKDIGEALRPIRRFCQLGQQSNQDQRLAQISSYFRFRPIYLLNRFRPISNILLSISKILGRNLLKIK